MADKRVLIVGGLAVVLLGVGALQFMGGPANEPRPEPKKPKQAEKKDVQPTKDFALPEGVSVAAARDPFAKPEGLAAATQTGPGRLPSCAPFEPPDWERTTQKTSPPKLEPLGGGGQAPGLPVSQALNGCGWEAVGVVVGPVPIAVLRDAAGEQVLVREGHMADDATRILKVTPRSVTVRHLKQTVTLAIGGGVVEDKK